MFLRNYNSRYIFCINIWWFLPTKSYILFPKNNSINIVKFLKSPAILLVSGGKRISESDQFGIVYNVLIRYATASAIVYCAQRPVRAMTFEPIHQDAAAAVTFLRRTMVLLLLLLMFSSLWSFPLVNAECPDKCTCIGTNVRCSFQQLDRIPDRISPATTEL